MAKKTQQEKLIDELLADYDGPESFWGESGLFAQLKKKIVERALDAEMDDHLGYSKHDPKGKKYFEGFNDKIIAMYARGMSVRDIQACLLEMYQVDVSEGLISQATEAVMAEVKAWQNRPLDEIYPIVFLDCIVVKCRQDGKVSNISVYLALGVNMDGQKELLGIWIAKTEGAKFWLGVITNCKTAELRISSLPV